MIKSVARQLQAEHLIEPNDGIVVGVSGGSDSMALLHILSEVNRLHDWSLRLHVAHLNHGLRGEEAKADAAFVQAAADCYAWPCSVGNRDIPQLAKDRKSGVEEVGRQERYKFFERVCLQTGAKFIALGHNADDHAETILHRLLRGTGLRGLAGIPRTRVLSPMSDIRIMRPLLGFTRGQIREFLVEAGVAYREDSSNQSNEPMRNQIRNVILPMLEAEVNPQTRQALTRLGEQAQWLEEFLRETVQRTFETLIVSHTDQQLVLHADVVMRKSRIVQTELVRLAYRTFGLGEQDLSFSHLVAAVELIADPSSGKQVQLPGGMTIEKRYHQLLFSLPTEEAREAIAPEVAVHVPGQTVLPVRRLKIDCEVHKVARNDIRHLRRQACTAEENVDLDSVRLPLVVRGRRPGDRFLPLGAPGSKKLSEFLIDNKVTPQDRNRVALLCDQLGPIWIIGHRIDDRVKLTGLTRRILHLRATPMDA